MNINYMISSNWCEIYNAQKQKPPEKLPRNCIIKKMKLKSMFKVKIKIKINVQRKNHKLELIIKILNIFKNIVCWCHKL